MLFLQVRGAAEAERLLQLPLLEFASSKSVRDGNRSRKREKAREERERRRRRMDGWMDGRGDGR